MSVGAEPDRSQTTLIYTILFLIWAFHVGRSQVDQLEMPVCRKKPAHNSSSSNNIFSNCSVLEELFFRFCSDSNITLETDPVASVDSHSSVFAYVDTPDDNITLFYKLCRFYSIGETDLIECTHNGTELEVEVEWKTPGVTNISVFVFTANVYSSNNFFGCARTSLIVARNHGLDLNVTVHNDPTSSSIQPAPFHPNNVDPSIPVDIFTSTGDDKGTYFAVGNVTLSCMTNRTDDMMYFKYTFSDGMNEPYANVSNVIHTYHEPGVYNYTVDAISINPKGDKAFHAKFDGQIDVLEPVSGISMHVNSENKFQSNIESVVNISAFGTRPLLACWYVEEADYALHHRIHPVLTNETAIAASRIYVCRQLNDQFIWEPMTFFDVGEYVFVAVFFNNVSQASSNISFGVISGPPKAVVASTSTLIAVLAFLIAIVCILMIVMGLYIPYRKYKTRFTETANFKFVELSDSTQWERAKMKVREFAERFNQNRKSSKVGLVNEQSESTRLLNFTPYETVS